MLVWTALRLWRDSSPTGVQPGIIWTYARNTAMFMWVYVNVRTARVWVRCTPTTGHFCFWLFLGAIQIIF